MSREPKTVPKELFDWDKDWTEAQWEHIEKQWGPSAETLGELVEFIRTADNFMAEDESEEPEIYETYVEDYSTDRSYSIDHVHKEYSNDTFGWIACTLLSAKRFRSELKKIFGTEEAKKFYSGLFPTFHLVEIDEDKYTLESPPECSIPIDHHNPAAEKAAQLLEEKYEQYRKRQEYVFHRNGDYWEVTFRKEMYLVKHSVGMSYIHTLLQHPFREKSVLDFRDTPEDCSELYRVVATEVLKRPSPSGPWSAREILDKDTWASMKDRLASIKRDLEAAEGGGDKELVGKLLDEKNKILSYCQSSYRPDKQSRAFDDDLEKPRKSVSIAIKRALDNLKEKNASLHLHLVNSIQLGSRPSYRPDRKIPWVL